jgi:hypothetical protein
MPGRRLPKTPFSPVHFVWGLHINVLGFFRLFQLYDDDKNDRFYRRKPITTGLSLSSDRSSSASRIACTRSRVLFRNSGLPRRSRRADEGYELSSTWGACPFLLEIF